MNITVKLFAHFRDGRFKVAEHHYPSGADCRQVILALGFRLGEMGIVMVNGQHARLDQTLNEADTLALFPLVGGG
jgi:molybdopterin converting factor small subunit